MKKVISALLVAASGSLALPTAASANPLSAAEAVSNWYNAYGNNAFNAIAADENAMGAASSPRNEAKACAKFEADARSAESHRVNYRPLQVRLAVAWKDFAESGRNCVAGIKRRDVGLVKKSAKELEAGNYQLTLAANAATGTLPDGLGALSQVLSGSGS